MFRAILRVAGAIVALGACFGLGVLMTATGSLSFLTGNVAVNTNIITVLESVQPLSQLTTTRYTFTNVITAERDLPALLRLGYGESLTITAVGYVTAGVDLDELRGDDFRVEGDTLTVVLPPPQVQDCFFDEGASSVIEQSRAAFANYPDNLQIQARQLAISQFRDQALKDGILEEAQVQAENTVFEFLSLTLSGRYENIVVITAAIVGTPPLPETCS